uniref:Uncharacterized protein n=1 Tax=Timema shepardi TaxID=629360 RepID=A0A7R9B7Q2_TIMSH|nr:unnamed protein product [Timema shepardi]
MTCIVIILAFVCSIYNQSQSQSSSSFTWALFYTLKHRSQKVERSGGNERTRTWRGTTHKLLDGRGNKAWALAMFFPIGDQWWGTAVVVECLNGRVSQYSFDGCQVRAVCFGGPAGRVVEPAAGGVGAIGLGQFAASIHQCVCGTVEFNRSKYFGLYKKWIFIMVESGPLKLQIKREDFQCSAVNRSEIWPGLIRDCLEDPDGAPNRKSDATRLYLRKKSLVLSGCLVAIPNYNTTVAPWGLMVGTEPER